MHYFNEWGGEEFGHLGPGTWDHCMLIQGKIVSDVTASNRDWLWGHTDEVCVLRHTVYDQVVSLLV